MPFCLNLCDKRYLSKTKHSQVTRNHNKPSGDQSWRHKSIVRFNWNRSSNLEVFLLIKKMNKPSTRAKRLSRIQICRLNQSSNLSRSILISLSAKLLPVIPKSKEPPKIHWTSHLLQINSLRHSALVS